MLKVSRDIKVATSLTDGGSVRFGNSFGLPSGKAYSCPGATSICERICYAGKLERLRPSVRDALMHNWDMLQGKTIVQMFELLDSMVTTFEEKSTKWNVPKAFRIHWDGDFFSQEYVWAWRMVINNHPDIRFWVYTRVSSAALVLNQLPNLSLYFSADAENVAEANKLAQLGIKIATLGDTFAEAKDLLGIRSAKCPEQTGQIPLAGACVACNICPKGNANVLFSISSR